MKKLCAFITATGFALNAVSALGATASNNFRVSAIVVSSCSVSSLNTTATVLAAYPQVTCVRNSLVTLVVEPDGTLSRVGEPAKDGAQTLTLYY